VVRAPLTVIWCPRSLTILFSSGEQVNYAKIDDINVPAGLLKMFLKSLPDSLVPISLSELMGALADISDEAERIKYLLWLLQNYLPDTNYATLKHIGILLFSPHQSISFANVLGALCSGVFVECRDLLAIQQDECGKSRADLRTQLDVVTR